MEGCKLEHSVSHPPHATQVKGHLLVIAIANDLDVQQMLAHLIKSLLVEILILVGLDLDGPQSRH